MYLTYTPQYFDLYDSLNWKKHLDEEGYVVIKDILNSDENTNATIQFKKDWNTVSPKFEWENTKTWTTNNSPMVWGKGSAVFNGFGQSKFMWMLRTNKKVQKAFAKLYDTDNLAVSFDGFSVFLSSKQKSPSWLHQDQRSNDTRLSIQGLVNLKKVGNEDAGFVCVPKSHKTHIPPSSNRDWVMLDKKDPHYTKAVKLLIPENCLTLWNSKTIHANCAMKNKHSKGLHLNRLSAYITFVPKTRQSDITLINRLQGYKNADSTSHWADRHEIKKLPFHLKKRYIERGFSNIKPLLEDGKIPNEYLDII